MFDGKNKIKIDIWRRDACSIYWQASPCVRRGKRNSTRFLSIIDALPQL